MAVKVRSFSPAPTHSFFPELSVNFIAILIHRSRLLVGTKLGRLLVELIKSATMPLDPRAIQIRVDGSCYQNPGGVAGCAAIVYYPEHLKLPNEQIVDYGCGESTNQRMELMPCIRALHWVREHQPWPDVTRVQIISDSTYVTNGVLYAVYWKKNRWRNRNGQPIFNDDLWDALLTARAKAGIRVDFIYEKGKKTVEGKVIHAAAKSAGQRGGIDKDTGYRPGAYCRSMVMGGVAEPFPANGQTDVIRPYAKKIMSKGENRISFNLFDTATNKYAKKLYAFATPLLAAELHRGHGYRVQFNADPKYPQISGCVEEVPLPKRSARKKSQPLS